MNPEQADIMMKILKVQTLRGPNYWSIRHQKLIVLQLDLAELREERSDEIPNFYQGLIELFPNLNSLRWNGFLQRLREGIFLEKIVSQVALELQSLAEMPVEFSCTRSTSTPGLYQVVFEYRDESDRTSILGIELAQDKEATKEILQKHGIPVPQGVTLDERAAQIVGLDIAGIDIVTPDISRPLGEVKGVEITFQNGLNALIKQISIN